MSYRPSTTIGFQRHAQDRETTIKAIQRSLNELAAVWQSGLILTFKDVQTLLKATGWRCQCCQRKHTMLHPLSGEHVFIIGSGRIGRNVPSNVRVVCTDCRRYADSKPDYNQQRRMKRQRQRATLGFVQIAA